MQFKLSRFFAHYLLQHASLLLLNLKSQPLTKPMLCTAVVSFLFIIAGSERDSFRQMNKHTTVSEYVGTALQQSQVDLKLIINSY